MSEARVTATKLRLVREAVHRNLPGAPRRSHSPVRNRTPSLPIWLVGCFLIASLVYLSLPAKLAPQLEVASADTAATLSSRPPAPPSTPPHRLARGVLPLSVRR